MPTDRFKSIVVVCFQVVMSYTSCIISLNTAHIGLLISLMTRVPSWCAAYKFQDLEGSWRSLFEDSQLPRTATKLLQFHALLKHVIYATTGSIQPGMLLPALFAHQARHRKWGKSHSQDLCFFFLALKTVQDEIKPFLLCVWHFRNVVLRLGVCVLRRAKVGNQL